MTDNVFVNFAINPPHGVAPLAVTFTDLANGAIEWWRFDFGDGYELTDRHSVFTHIYTAPGEYRPAMQAGRGTLTAGVVKRIQVDAPPVVASFTMWPTSGVSSLEVAFTDTSAGHPKVWAWDFGDGAASTEQHPTHLYTQPGVYYPTLIAANEYGSDEIRSPSPVVVEEYVEPDPVEPDPVEPDPVEPDPVEPDPPGPNPPTPVSEPWYRSPLLLVGVGLGGYVLYRAASRGSKR